jgi:hypothetical protein
MTILLLLLAAATPIDSLYSSGNYEAVVEQAPLFLASPALGPDDSIAVNLLYASALVALGRTGEASTVFRGLLARQPDLVLAPERFSPKIRGVFEQVRAESPLAPATPTKTDTVYLRRRAPLSALVPGFDQIRNRQPVKGWAMLGAGALAVAGAGLSHALYNRSRGDYVSATEPNDISSRYATANAWYKTRAVAVGSALGIWLYSLIDALARQ